MATKTKTKPTTIDQYLAAAGADQRAALEKLRRTIKAMVPAAEECINYGVAAFRLNGKAVAGFGASAEHCSFYPMSGAIVAALRDELKGYKTSKGAIQFQPAKPLPASLVRKLLKARIAEIDGGGAKAGTPRARVTKRAALSSLHRSQADPAVTEYLREMDHPLKSAIEAVRRIILGVSPEIKEGIKWNSPSFRTAEYFATLNVRGKDGADRVWLILHRGAKAKDHAKAMQIPDPAGLLNWLAMDRCLIAFDDLKDARAKAGALKAIVRAWIEQL